MFGDSGINCFIKCPAQPSQFFVRKTAISFAVRETLHSMDRIFFTEALAHSEREDAPEQTDRPGCCSASPARFGDAPRSCPDRGPGRYAFGNLVHEPLNVSASYIADLDAAKQRPDVRLNSTFVGVDRRLFLGFATPSQNPRQSIEIGVAQFGNCQDILECVSVGGGIIATSRRKEEFGRLSSREVRGPRRTVSPDRKPALPRSAAKANAILNDVENAGRALACTKAFEVAIPNRFARLQRVNEAFCDTLRTRCGHIRGQRSIID